MIFSIGIQIDVGDDDVAVDVATEITRLLAQTKSVEEFLVGVPAPAQARRTSVSESDFRALKQQRDAIRFVDG